MFDPAGIGKYVDHRALFVKSCAGHVGQDVPTLYWREVLHAGWRGPYPKHWCGAFALAHLRWVGLTSWLWEIPDITPGGRVDGQPVSGFISRLAPKFMQVSRAEIEPGDVCYLDAPYQHHAVVERVENGIVYTIDGNQGSGRTFVARREHRANDRRWLHYSIKTLLPAMPVHLDLEPAASTHAVSLMPGNNVEGAES